MKIIIGIIGVWVFIKIVEELAGIFIIGAAIAYFRKSLSAGKKDVE